MEVREIMEPGKSKSNYALNAGESIDNAAALMRDNKIQEVNVLDEEGKIIGKVTKDALIEASDELNEDFFLE